MAQIYNISELNTGSNIAEWLLIVNGWSGSVIFTVLMIGLSLLLFGIMIKAGMSVEGALVASSWSAFLISGLLWLVEFNGIRAMPTSLVVLFALFSAISVFFVVVRNWME